MLRTALRAARRALRRLARAEPLGPHRARAAPSTSTGTSTSPPASAIKAAFELGTGVDINIYPPERAAADLREMLRRIGSARVPPNPRPIPRFIADAPRRGSRTGASPSGWRRRSARRATEIEELPEGVEPPDELDWFPERAWGGRVWVPCTRREPRARRATLELFGHVSYAQPAEGEPTDFRATADFTDVLAEDNPDWRIDLNDDVIGRWRGENGRAGDVTLVWGRPLVRGAVAATAELELETVDQEAISNDRFTLLALDALEGYGDDDLHAGQALEPPRPGAGLREPLRLATGSYPWLSPDSSAG